MDYMHKSDENGNPYIKLNSEKAGEEKKNNC